MNLEPGMRVRCVRGSMVDFRLVTDVEYTIADTWASATWVNIREVKGGWLADRFEPVHDRRGLPVVRVKAVCVRSPPSLEVLLKRAVAAFDALTPEQQAEHLDLQRKSWIRGEMGLGL